MLQTDVELYIIYIKKKSKPYTYKSIDTHTNTYTRNKLNKKVFFEIKK